MNWRFNDDSPIFTQIAKFLEDDIFTGLYPEESQVPSTTETSINYKLNPATVLKGYNSLVDEGLIYKKRGIGMFVAEGAKAKIKKKRQADFSNDFIKPMIKEAKKLNLTQEDVISEIREEFK